MSQPLAPKGGNDRVYTPPAVAEKIVMHFDPSGMVVEPCAGPRGRQAFVDALSSHPFVQVKWCELDEGIDFFETHLQPCDWIITNPPWSKLRAFLNRAMEVSDNVVFLCLVNAFFMKARQEDMKKAGFGMKEILFVATPAKPWPQTGFSLGAVHIQRGYTGKVTFSNLEEI